MSDQNAHLPARAPGWRQGLAPRLWLIASALVAFLVLSPLLSVLWIALNPSENIWPHLAATVLPRYLANTLILMAGVAVLTAAIGTGAAWLVTMYRFPGSRWLSTALLFPLAIPAYVGAYAMVDLLDYAGPLQTLLRAAFGWQTARDYPFFEVRALGPAIVVFAAALYPYVYLLARAAFREQSGGTYDTARALGAGPLALFLKVGLPLARPAIATGVALALMETVADYGTVLHFGVQTLTTGIFSTWLNGGNAGGAAQIALVAMALILLLVALEHSGRRRQRHFRTGRARHPLQPERLEGWRAGLAFGLAALPFVAGFVLPVAVMVGLSLQSPTAWASPDLLRAFFNTVTLSAGAALVTVGAALVLVHGVRAVRPGLARALLPWTALGYAAPGAVLALGLLFPMAAVDHRVADGILALTGHDPGLLFTGTALGVGLAYVLRFFAIAQGAVDAAHGRIGPNLGAAARALGRGPGGALRAVYMPLMRGSVATAILIVFVDCVKELPATLLLRPFNFETLATRTFELVSLERLSEAAPAALLVMAVGLGAVAVLARANR